MKKCLVPDLGQENNEMNMEHLVILDSKEATKDERPVRKTE